MQNKKNGRRMSVSVYTPNLIIIKDRGKILAKQSS